MASKYVDSSAIIQIIGCVFNNPALLGFKDKYIFSEEDFPNDFHKIIFGVLYKLYEGGASSITLENIEDYLAVRPKSLEIYKKNKGDEWIAKVSDGANQLSFDYYYSRLKKMSLLRAYDNCGIDVSDIYDPDNILDVKKKQLQEDLLDNSSLEDIASIIDKKIDDIRLKYAENCYNESAQAGEGIEDLIQKFKEVPEVGVPLYGSLVNSVTRGARLGKFYLRSAATGVGKAIPNYTKIPTPQGYKRVDEIKVGDYLFGQDGKPTEVLAVYPQPEEKEIWKVTFSDGRVAECCGEHLWEYRYETHRGFAYRTEDIQTIYNRTLSLKNGLKNSNNRGYRFHIKLNEEVQHEPKEYSIHPYVMGALLGDGSFRYNNTNKSISFSSETNELPNKIATLLGKNVVAIKSSDFNYSYCFKYNDNMKHNIWVEEILQQYPDLWNTKSETKFIPKNYLEGSAGQRWDLLRGLMDTDGSIDENGRTTFTTISERLRDDFIELIHSLGMIASFTEDMRPEKYTTGKCYNIHIQCRKSLKPCLFTLERKVNKALSYSMSNKREEFKDHLAIISIEKTNEKTAMTCFTVDNDSHLFLMNDYIVTHNTRSMIADACYIACDRIYDESFGWIKNGVSEPVLFIATEQDLSEVQTMMLAFLSNVNEEHILNGRYDGDEEDRVIEAAKILQDSPLYVEVVPDFSLQDIENIIKKNIREKDVQYVFNPKRVLGQ